MCEKITKFTNRVDAHLSKLDLTRKGIVKDDSCIFRAVSERLFNTQFFHGHVKKTCLDYLSRHVDEYQPFVQGSIIERIKLLEERKTAAGQMEMIILSKIYKMDFILFLPSPFGHFNLTQNGFNKQISLCYMDNDHYDLVFSKTFTQVAAFCQSILYEVLYKNVFGLNSEIDEAVIFLQLQKHLTKDTNTAECALADALSFFGQDKSPVLERIAGRSSPPLPYRVAKALHPTLYRNVELDIVHEEIREERFRKQAYLRRFVPGDKCQVILNDNDDESKSYRGHIQELDVNGDTVVVYIEELTVKKALPTSCVKPLPIQLPQTGNHTILPIAEIDVLKFLRKGGRKKTMPIALIPEADIPSSSSISASCQPQSTPPPPSLPQSPESPPLASDTTHQTGRRFARVLNKENYQTQDTPIKRSSSRVNAEHKKRLGSPASDSGQYCEGSNFHAIATPPVGITPFQSNCGPLTQGCVFDPAGYQVTPAGLIGPQPFTPCPPPVAVEENCVVPSGFDPYYCTYVPDMSQTTPSQGPMYLMPVVAVPYASNMGQVNMNWTPSQDPYGKDLPLSDINTLRFFFNLGVEYYRMSSGGQQPSVNYGQGLMYIPPSIPEVVTPSSTLPDINSNSYTSVPTTIQTIQTDTSVVRDSSSVAYVSNDTQSGQTSLSSGESRTKSVYSGNVKTTTAIGGKGNDKCSKMNEEGKSAVLPNKLNENNNIVGEYSQSEKREGRAEKKGERGDIGKEKEKSVEGEDSGSDHMDVGSDGDSGCPSECADLSPINGTDAEFVASDATSNAGELSSGVIENGKPKGKRRYYMYGNHKLIKPIKEIPLRFQMLLAETSAAKARCEGQPIYMQQPPPVQQPSYDIIYYTSDGTQPQQTQSLNANASCFVPSQNGDCNTISYVPDEYSVCSMSNFPGSSSNASLQPAPLFVPPPPQVLNQSPSNSAQPCPTIIMYSAASTASSFPQNLQSSPACTPSSQTLPHAQPLSVPPPFPPPSSVPPPSVDTSPINYPPTVTQLKPAFPVNSAPCPSTLSAKSGMKKNAPSKPLSLNIPPTNVAVPKPASQTVVNSLPTHAVTHTAPPHNACLVPLPSNPYSTPSHPNISSNPHATSALNPAIGLASQAPPIPSSSNPLTSVHVPTVPSSNACVSYPTNSGNQYMYVYPSTPTGPPSNPPQGAVMYMVSPAYPTTNFPSPAFQQQGLILPSVATQ